ncbi:hypothetical protein [Armatimonas sp.]|uniref:hypothetical protein n=1 Tax=Armatimonas sp. TaxID=1872638 RepID=UPI0037521842
MVKIFTLPKDENAPEANEDAVVSELSRLALADGASSDAFSGLWAQQLCTQFVQTGGLNPESAALGWRSAIGAKPLPWFLADKLRQPTHASFLGLEWGEQLTAQAIGDSCVFVIRDSALALAFPYARAEDFASHPALVPTQGVVPTLQRTTLALEPGDTILAATDALAAWLLAESAQEPWNSLLALQNPGDFARFVQALRSARRLALDDTTLAIVAPDTKES